MKPRVLLNSVCLCRILNFFVLVVPVLCAPGYGCSLSTTSPGTTAPVPQSQAGLDYQRPSHRSPAAILDRLDSESKIRSKLTLSSRSLDRKNLTGFDRIFAPDAVVNFGEPVGLIRGLENIKREALKQVASVNAQSLLGTQAIQFSANDPCTASSASYFSVSLFGQGDLQGKVSMILIQYWLFVRR